MGAGPAFPRVPGHLELTRRRARVGDGSAARWSALARGLLAAWTLYERSSRNVAIYDTSGALPRYMTIGADPRYPWETRAREEGTGI